MGYILFVFGRGTCCGIFRSILNTAAWCGENDAQPGSGVNAA